MRVVPGLTRVLGQSQGVNAYLWDPGPGKQPILFDCGWPWSWRALLEGLRKAGRIPSAISVVAVTHDDVDHSGTLHQWRGIRNVSIQAAELERSSLAGREWRPVPGYGGLVDPIQLAATVVYGGWPKRPVVVDRALRDGDELGGGWWAVLTPGHTTGHTAYFHPVNRILIAGDAIGSMQRGRIRPPAPQYASDRAQALRSVARLSELRPDVICFGHGPEAFGAADSLADLARSLR